MTEAKRHSAALTYTSYLALDEVLSAQRPGPTTTTRCCSS